MELDGSFNKSGTLNCDDPVNPLGLKYRIYIISYLVNTDLHYGQSGTLEIYDDRYSPGIYYVTIPHVPSKVPLHFRFQAEAEYALIDTYQYTDQINPDLNDPQSVKITKTEVRRTGDNYSVSGEADFYHTLTFGSLIALRDGMAQPDVTITSPNGEAYTPATIPVAIDIKPGDSTASINSASRGTTPVVVLSNSMFDAVSTIDVKTLTFGLTGYENSPAFCNPNGEDLNNNGFTDLVCHFYTLKAGFKPAASQGILKGKLSLTYQSKEKIQSGLSGDVNLSGFMGSSAVTVERPPFGAAFPLFPDTCQS